MNPNTLLHETLADALWQAQQTRVPIDPPSRANPSLALADAYAIQRANTLRGVAAGRRLCGRKIGLTSLAVQQRFGVSRPDFGVLFADMNVGEGLPIAADRLMQPQAEVELAFILGRPLDFPQPTVADVLRAVEYVVPAIEIVDSRIRDWQIGLVDTVADNASSGLFVLGSLAQRVAGLDLAACRMVLEKNGEIASQGEGAACLGSPLNAVRWLAETLLELGDPLGAGDVVLSGALGPLVPVAPGDSLRAVLPGLGSVSASFARGAA